MLSHVQIESSAIKRTLQHLKQQLSTQNIVGTHMGRDFDGAEHQHR